MGKTMKQALVYLLAFCLLSGTFAATAAWAINGGRFPKGKKAVLTVFLSLFTAAAPYEVVVLAVNTLIFHGTKPLFSIVISAFVQILIVALCAVLTVVYLIRGKKEETGA